MNYLCEELILTFIRLADVIININCIAAVKFSTYNRCGDGKEIPVVNICLTIPEGSLDGETQVCCQECCQECQGVEKLEYESDLAIAIWNYFSQCRDVTILFE
ncbi:MAG TPA: hypothetical protein DEG17_18075 [Cyanobacteria bacterium UBA11149]|nr:hypothetical protein [Cyanobacteria bacterium UBA11367]HBE56108.1 hypothetical protein [Cyanobacteria bacterium UBA11366]HBK65843.1 hypothetical protein [Cyanobacteria bacterium UBA11166]HBR75147.1 hypothetical protein [Cyanobacteria bacterium UBA11159]HBS70102.1 hypothetical protein [Cyanobacteria bacterium UBA11153]HBW90726.1 hypothetical protein [Cyanobacteria bacterium UBA11149]HCA93447.1 hypothetical protein [Cyanobacteria bacterium UBA9226]